MRLSQKINIILFFVFVVFFGIGVVVNYQYGCVQESNQLKELIKYHTEKSELDSVEIISSIMLNRKDAIELYLKSIESRDNLRVAAVLSDNEYMYETASQKCIGFHAAASGICAVKRNDSYDYYYKMSYGNGNFGYLKKSFLVVKNSFLSLGELLKLVLIFSILYFLILIVLSKTLKNILVKPLQNICKTIQPLRRGEFNIHIPKQSTEELNYLSSNIVSIVRELKNYQNEITRHTNLASIGQSTAMVAHDVRKPLAGMKALLSSLPAIKNDPKQLEKMIASVDSSISQTNSLLNDILEFSRDSTSLDLSESDPQVIITSALSDALRNRKYAGVKISYDLKHSHVLHVDSNRIIRVLINIMDNALDAMEFQPKAANLLQISTDEIERGRKRFIAISVADNGPGLTEETLTKVFDPFFTQGKSGGTGLGLAICYRIITMHGGRIEAKNRGQRQEARSKKKATDDGQTGAEFTIELPAGEKLAQINEAELIHNSSELKPFREEEVARIDYGDTANTTEFMKLNKKKGRLSYLLVVDDEPLFRESIRCLLGELGQVKDHVKVVEADSAEKALALFKSQEFDYVIADIDLGKRKMNGYEFVGLVLDKYPNTHVLIHSNKRKEELDISIRLAAANESRFTPARRRSSGGNHDSRFLGF